MTRFARFVGVGVVGFLCDAGVFHMLVTFAAMSPYVAKVVSYFAAATLTWWLNRRFTFAPTEMRATEQWLRFLAVNAVGAVVNYGVFALMLNASTMAMQYPLIAVAAGALAGLVFNFLLSQKFAFAPQAASNIGMTSRHSS